MSGALTKHRLGIIVLTHETAVMLAVGMRMPKGDEPIR
jgi:hypothetical protein